MFVPSLCFLCHSPASSITFLYKAQACLPLAAERDLQQRTKHMIIIILQSLLLTFLPSPPRSHTHIHTASYSSTSHTNLFNSKMDGIRRWVTQRARSIPENLDTLGDKSAPEEVSKEGPPQAPDTPNQTAEKDPSDISNRESSLGVMMEYEA